MVVRHSGGWRQCARVVSQGLGRVGLRVGGLLSLTAAMLLLGPAARADTTESIWTGTTSTDWSNSANWGNGVPSSTIGAEFNSAFTNQPTLTASSTAQGLWVTGATLTTGASGATTIGAASAENLAITGTATLDGLSNVGILLDGTGNNNLTIGSSVATTIAGSTSFLVNNAGTLTIQGGLTISAGSTLTIGGTNSLGSVLISGPIANTTGALTMAGAGTLTLSGSDAYTGPTTISAGVLNLDFTAGGAPASNIISNNAPLILAGGTLQVTGNSAAKSQLFAETVLTTGASAITGSGTLASPGIALGAIARNAGSTVNFTLPTAGSITTTTANTGTSILGGWATVGGNTWAVSAGTGTAAGAITGLSSYSATFTTGTNVDAPIGTSAPASGLVINSLRFNNAGAYTLNDAGGMTITTGGILETANVGANNITINATSTGLFSGNGQDFIVIQNNTAGTLTVTTNIGSASAFGLTKSGPGTFIENGSNSYTGPTTVNGGILEFSANGTFFKTNTTGAVAINNGGELLANVTNTITDNGTVATAPITVNAGGLLQISAGLTSHLGSITLAGGTLSSVDTGNASFGTWNLDLGLSAGGTSATSTISAQNVDLSQTGGTVFNVNSGAANGIDLDVTRFFGKPGSATNTALIKTGTGVMRLDGANTFTIGTTIAAGTLQVGNGTSGSLASMPLTFVGTGTTNFAETAGSSQSMGALTVSSGEATVQSTYPGSGTTTLTFSSLAARPADNGHAGGADLNIVSTGGTNGTTNKIVLTGVTTNTEIGPDVFFGGSNFAYYDTAGLVRGINWGSSDVNQATTPGGATLGTNSSTTYVRMTGAVTAQTTAAVAGLNISGANSLTLGGGVTLTIGNSSGPATILKSGGGTSTISGGTGIAQTSANGEFVIRTDQATDNLIISSQIIRGGGTTDLVKSGAGTLTLSNSANNYAGTTYINGGVLSISFVANQGNNSNLGNGSNIVDTLLNGGTVQWTGTSSNNSTNDIWGLGPSGGAIDAEGTGALLLTNGVQISNIANGAQTLMLTGSSTQLNTISSVGLANGTGNVTSLVKSGIGTWQLSVGNTYTGGTTIQAGTLIVSVSGALGTGAITLGSTTGNNPAAQLVGANSSTYSNPIVLAFNTGAGPLTLGNTGSGVSTIFSGGVTGTGNLTINENATTGAITLATGSVNNLGTLTNTGFGSGTTLISSVIGSNVTGVVENSLASALTLSGANTFPGGVSILAGTVTASTSATALGTGPVTLGSTTGSNPATLLISTTGLTFSNPIALATNPSVGVLTVGETGNITATTYSGGVTGNNSLVINNTSNTTSTITFQTNTINNSGSVTNIGNSASATTISSIIGPSVTRLVENSTSSGLTLTAANTYTGPTTISAGTLTLGNVATGPVISPSSTLVFGGGTLADSGTSTATQTFASTALNAGGSTVQASGSIAHLLALGTVTPTLAPPSILLLSAQPWARTAASPPRSPARSPMLPSAAGPRSTARAGPRSAPTPRARFRAALPTPRRATRRRPTTAQTST